MNAESISKIIGSVAVLATALATAGKLIWGDSLAKQRLKTDLDVLKSLKDLGFDTQTLQKQLEIRTQKLYSEQGPPSLFVEEPFRLLAAVIVGVGMLLLAYYLARAGSYFWAGVLGFYSMGPFLFATDFMGRWRGRHQQRMTGESDEDSEHNNGIHPTK